MVGPQLIGLCGYSRCGKNTVGDHLSAKHGYQQRAFADKLRELAAAIDPTLGTEVYESCEENVRTYNEVIADIGYERAKDAYPEVRRFLVALGAGVRNVLGGGIWLDACLPDDTHPADFYRWNGHNGPPAVITDVRYLNEAQRIVDLGGQVWYIQRQHTFAANEEEERTINDILDQHLPEHYIFNNYDVPELLNRVSLLVENS